MATAKEDSWTLIFLDLLGQLDSMDLGKSGQSIEFVKNNLLRALQFLPFNVYPPRAGKARRGRSSKTSFEIRAADFQAVPWVPAGLLIIKS